PMWTQLSPAQNTNGGSPAPAKRLLQSTAYDPATNSMIAFGGATQDCGNFGVYNDTWVLTHADGTGGTSAWIQLLPSGAAPAARLGAGGVYDSASNRLIPFGRAAFDHTDPAARGELGSAGVYDAGDNMLLIFGGRGASADFNDLWVLSNANGLGGAPVWTQQSPVAGPPPARHAHTVTYDSVDNALMVIGGVDFTETQFLRDVWWLR